jgi:hypothetical protein
MTSPIESLASSDKTSIAMLTECALHWLIIWNRLDRAKRVRNLKIHSSIFNKKIKSEDILIKIQVN